MFARFASRGTKRKLQRKATPTVRLSIEELESRQLLSGFVDNFEAATLNPLALNNGAEGAILAVGL